MGIGYFHFTKKKRNELRWFYSTLFRFFLPIPVPFFYKIINTAHLKMLHFRYPLKIRVRNFRNTIFQGEYDENENNIDEAI